MSNTYLPRRHWIVAVALTSLMTGCQRIECEEFRLDHPLMGWHWFADLQPDYTFVNAQGVGVQLTRTEYERQAAEKHWCHMCAGCGIELRADYSCEALGTLFQCDVAYEGLAESGEDDGSIYYGINRLHSTQRGYRAFSSRDSTLEEYVYQNSSPQFTIRRRASVTLLTTTVADVLELTVRDTAEAGVETVWVKKGQGLLAFKRRGVLWLKR